VLNRENLGPRAINGLGHFGAGKNAEGCPRERLVPRLRIIASTVRRYIRRHGAKPIFCNAIYRQKDLERLMYKIAARC